jgi:hypothetical protein
LTSTNFLHGVEEKEEEEEEEKEEEEDEGEVEAPGRSPSALLIPSAFPVSTAPCPVE